MYTRIYIYIYLYLSLYLSFAPPLATYPDTGGFIIATRIVPMRDLGPRRQPLWRAGPWAGELQPQGPRLWISNAGAAILAAFKGDIDKAPLRIEAVIVLTLIILR